MALFRISSERKLVSTSTITALSSIPSLLSLFRSKTTTTSVKWNRSAFLRYVSDRCQSDSVRLEEIYGSFYILIKSIHSPYRPVSINHFDQLLEAVYRTRIFPSTVFSLWRVMQFFRIQPSPVTVNILTNCACSIDPGVDRGFAVFGMSLKRGIGLKVATLSTLLTMVFRKGDPGQWNVHVRKAAAEKKSRASPSDDEEVINSICTNGRTKEALHLVEEISQSIKNPTLFTYTSLFHSLCISRRWKKLFAESLDLEILPDPPKLCDALIDSLCREGMIPEASGVFDLMIERGFRPTEAAFHLLMRGFCLNGLVKKAKSVFNLMVAKYHKPTALTYRILIDGYFRDGRLDKAVLLFKKIRSEGLTPDTPTYTTLMRSVIRNSEAFSKDLKIPSLSKHCKLVLDQSTTNRVEEAAKELLIFMQANGLEVCTEICTAIFMGMRNAGKFKEARDFLFSISMNDKIMETVLYNLTISGFYSQWMFDEAWDMFQKMEEKGLHPNLVTYGLTICGCVMKGEMSAGPRNLVKMMEENGITLDHSTLEVLLNDCLYHQATINKTIQLISHEMGDFSADEECSLKMAALLDQTASHGSMLAEVGRKHNVSMVN